MKKIMVLVLTLITMFVFAACDEFNLDEYKTNAKVTLENYAKMRGPKYCFKDNWAEIQQIVVEGKAAIDEANGKTGVDSAREAAEDKISLVSFSDIGRLVSYEKIKFSAELLNSKRPHGTMLIREYDELISAFGESYKIIRDDDLLIKERYDSSFFEDKAILLHFFGGEVSALYHAEKVGVDNGILKLLIFGVGSMGLTAIYETSITVELNKNEIADVDSIDTLVLHIVD